MPYTFSATGLPPGLSLVGSTIAGTPTTPGAYTVTLSVTDGVSTVSETAVLTIAAIAAVPIPIYQLILSAESGGKWGEAFVPSVTAAVESGSFWREMAIVVPTVTAITGSRWGDSALALVAESGSYWGNTALPRPTISAESGLYWQDAASAVVVVGDTAYVATHLPGVPSSQRQAVADAALAGAAALADGSTQYNLIDVLAARAFNWLVFRPGSAFQNATGSTVANAGNQIGRIEPWIGSINATIPDSNRPFLTSSTGASFTVAGSTYLICATATFALPASFSVARKTNALFSTGTGSTVFGCRPANLDKPGVAASNETLLLAGVTYQGATATTTNKIQMTVPGDPTAGEINGVPVVSLTEFGAYNYGTTLPNATGFNLIYSAQNSASGSKSLLIGTDTYSGNTDSGYWEGEIADLLWLNATPTTIEKNRLTAFLKQFWSIT